ncbi:unnamed protein product [Arctia plantaginis]|uniref:Uncharacterized protein n=1 Tax=Arctia plantaginis TaxID=874455 RepID=A0A8S1AAX2_ARCPL|nr:unnamed protein product [Arctia plantaginis]
MASVRDRYRGIYVENDRICDEFGCESAGGLPWQYGARAPHPVLAHDPLNRKEILFWSTSAAAEVYGISYRCKSVSPAIIPMAALPFRLVVRARFSIGPRWLAALRAVSRPRSSVRDVCPRKGSACVPPVLVWQYRGCERDSNLRERESAMAVSQPRPPDRVDAALEKVAPLRYLEAHECARSEQVVTRFYHFSLSLDRFLSYKKIPCIRLNIVSRLLLILNGDPCYG